MNPEDQRTSCPGFLDEYGVWNNGFECPSLSGQIRICCGSESRRYCCTLDNRPKVSDQTFNRALERPSHSHVVNSVFFSEKKSPTLLNLPVFLTCLIGLIIIFILLLLTFLIWYRCRNRRNNVEKKSSSTTSNLLTEHFPFSQPHNQFFLHETNGHYERKPSLPHHPTKETLATASTVVPSSTTSTSSSSGRAPSDIYFHDWKDFLISGEQPMNLYPTMSSYSNEMVNDHHSAYLFHGKRQHHDVIV